MTARTITLGVAALAALLLLAFVPQLVNAYYLALAISLLQYTVLATAWGMFSGPTRYVSLATTAFFGVGAYTVAVFGEVLPWPLVLLIAAGLGAVLAAVVGLSTLRLERRLFRHLHVWPGRARAPAGRLVRGQQVARARPLHLRRYHASRHLLAAAGPRRYRLRPRLADRALPSRLCPAHHRRGRDRRHPLRHQHDDCEGGPVRHQRHRHGADRRDHGAALDLYRAVDRVQRDDLVPGADHGAARRRAPPVGARARRGAAGAAVRTLERALSEHVHDHSRLHFPRHRLHAAARRRGPARGRIDEAWPTRCAKVIA